MLDFLYSEYQTLFNSGAQVEMEVQI